MERWSLSQFSTYRWSLEQDIQSLPNFGFENIGIWNRKLAEFDQEYFADWLFENQTKVSSLSWIGGFTGSEGVSFCQAVREAKEEIRVASRIGAATVIVHPGGRNGHTLNHARRLLYNALEELVPFANDYGIRLAIEPMDRQSHACWSIFGNFDETIEFATLFSPDELGLVLDLFYVGLDSSVFDCLEILMPRIALVQLADRRLTANESLGHDRVPLGGGNVNIESWIYKLESVGYKGMYEIELFGREFEMAGYEAKLSAIAEWCKQHTSLFETTSKTKS